MTKLEHKDELVKALAGHPKAREALRVELQNPIKMALWKRDFRELRELAQVLNVPHEGVSRWDLISALAADPRVDGHLLHSPPTAPRLAPQAPVEVPVEAPPAAAPQPSPENAPEPLPSTPPVEESPQMEEPLQAPMEPPPAEAPGEPPAIAVAASAAMPEQPPEEPTEPPQPSEPAPPNVTLMPMPRSSAPPRPPAPSETEGEIVLMVDPDEAPTEAPPSPPGPVEVSMLTTPPPPPAAMAPSGVPPPPRDRRSKLHTLLPYPGDMVRLHNLLTEADRRYTAGDHTIAMAQAREAIAAFEQAEARYLQSAWAHVMASMEALVEGARGPAPALEEAREALAGVRKAFAAGRLRGQSATLDRAMAAISALYLSEVEVVRQDLARAMERLREVAAMGARVADIQEALSGANEILRSGDRAQGMEVLRRAGTMMDEAARQRLEEMRASMVALDYTLQEARTLGANTGGAERLAEQGRAALDAGEGILAHELIQRAERALAECQRTQVNRALDLHQHQLEKVKEVVRRIKPILIEAQLYGLDVNPVRVYAKEGLLRIRQGDHINALVYAKQAAEATRALLPQLLLERAKRGIVKPPGGICGRCTSRNLEFDDDGWGRCRDCSMEFRWRRMATPQAILQRLKSTILPN